MGEEFKTLKTHQPANYFIEVQDHLLTNKTFKQEDQELHDFNEQMLNFDLNAKQKLGLCYLGRQAPGNNNIVDGLLRYQS